MTNLRTLRTSAKLSQSQLADKSSVSLPMIQKYEQKVKDINKAQADTIYKLAKALNCKMEDLIEKDHI